MAKTHAFVSVATFLYQDFFAYLTTTGDMNIIAYVMSDRQDGATPTGYLAKRWILNKYPHFDGIKSVQLNRANPGDLVKIHLIADTFIYISSCDR